MTLAEMGLFFCVNLVFVYFFKIWFRFVFALFYSGVFIFSCFFKRCIENKSCSLLRGDITEPLQIEEYLKTKKQKKKVYMYFHHFTLSILDKLTILQITMVKLRRPSAIYSTYHLLHWKLGGLFLFVPFFRSIQ